MIDPETNKRVRHAIRYLFGARNTKRSRVDFGVENVVLFDSSAVSAASLRTFDTPAQPCRGYCCPRLGGIVHSFLYYCGKSEMQRRAYLKRPCCASASFPYAKRMPIVACVLRWEGEFPFRSSFRCAMLVAFCARFPGR